MEYLQLPFKLILQYQNIFSTKKLNISTWDYSYYIKNFNNVEFPISKPKYGIEDYQIEEEKWKVECLKNSNYRNNLKTEIISDLQYIYNEITDSKLNPRPFNYAFQNIYEYCFYHKILIDSWISAWQEVNVEYESLETLILFKKILSKYCLNQEAIDMDDMKRNKMWDDDIEEAKSERKYWNNNYYEEGGGGLDWSDPF